jgi:hypothetical protein
VGVVLLSDLTPKLYFAVAVLEGGEDLEWRTKASRALASGSALARVIIAEDGHSWRNEELRIISGWFNITLY